MSALITIGIPTFNRLNTLKRCVEHLKTLGDSFNVEVLIIDNCSTDGSFKYLQDNSENTKFRIFKNNKNIGLAGNTIELLKKCNTDYLLWCPDEDDVIKENIKDLLEFIKKNNPTLICPQYFINKSLYRGKQTIKKINPSELWNSVGHLPGVLFHVPTCDYILKKIEFYKTNFPTTYKYYPQIFFTTISFLEDKCFYWNKPICKQVDFLKETHDLDDYGNTYDGLNIRWLLHKEFVNLIKIFSREYKNKQISKKILRTQRLSLFNTIRKSIGYESENELLFFDIGSFLGSLKNTVRFLIKIVFKTKAILKKIFLIFK